MLDAKEAILADAGGLQIPITDNGRAVLERRYLRRGTDGKPVEEPKGMFRRVAHHIALVEDTLGGDSAVQEGVFYRLLTEFRFFPNSPTFTGAGTPLAQLAACFVLPVEDDMGRADAGIFQTLKDAALIQQTGGGNGFSFSRLRPRGSLVHSSSGEATGPVGFLRVYDQAFGVIAQGGVRRGANMAVLRVDHPDIREFVTCKTDENSVSNFNISVGVTDAFMQAVRGDEIWELRFPDVEHPAYTSFQGTINQAERAGLPVRTYHRMPAREMFGKIARQAHHNGEPGVLFLDAINRDNPVPHLYELEATNPCFVGETRIATECGLLTIEEMAGLGAPLRVATDNRAPYSAPCGAPGGGAGVPSAEVGGVAFRPSTPAWLTRRKAAVLRLTTQMGFTVTATPDHRFLTPGRGYVALQELRPGDELLLQSAEGAWGQEARLPNVEWVQSALAEMESGGGGGNGRSAAGRGSLPRDARLPDRWSHGLGVVAGWLLTDSWLRPDARGGVGITFSDASPLELVHGIMREWFGPAELSRRGDGWQLLYGRLPAEFFLSLGVAPLPDGEQRIPHALWKAPREAVVGLLQGLFSSAGSVQHQGGSVVCLPSPSPVLLSEVQLLLSNFGILSSIRRTPVGHTGTGVNRSREIRHELVIAGSSRERFAELIGFLGDEKQRQLLESIAAAGRPAQRETFAGRVASVAEAGRADVYDLTEPATHSLIANGLVAHNCGEQALGPYENCCLGSINMARHVCIGESGKWAVDWPLLQRSVQESARFLDDVVDANNYVPAVPQLREAAMRARRIGLGIMGLGDMMYQLGIRYGSSEAQEFAGQVMEFVRYHAMATSVELAGERGPFTAIAGSRFDPDNLAWTPTGPLLPYSRDWGRPALDWEGVIAGIKRHGIRNAAQTTIAPTGTIATVAGCEAYGCEPVFALAYVRHVNDNGKDLELTYTSPLFMAALDRADLDEATKDRIIERVIQTGSCQDIDELPEGIRHTFVVARDLSIEEHVRMQAALQVFVDNCISKTINAPAGTTVQEVQDAYELAWELGCKGLTIYVTGSRERVVLETKKAASSAGEAVPLWPETKKPRPRLLPGKTYRIGTPSGTTHITVNENGGNQPFEVFIHASKAGSETNAVSEAMGRLISLSLRLASPVAPRERLAEVVQQLAGIGGGRSLGFGPNRVLSLPDGIAQCLNDYLEEGQPEGITLESGGPAPGQMELRIGDLCPDCGQAAVVREEGCRKCYNCAYSEC